MSRQTASSGTDEGRREDQSAPNHRLRSGNEAARRAPGDGAGSGWSRHSTALPGWTDLERPAGRSRPEGPGDGSFFERISTVRFAMAVLVLAGTFTLYVGHVHATRDLLSEVQELRSENKRLHLKRNRLRGKFARKTSPSVIYDRARELGLQASVTYGPPVTVEE